MLCMKAFKDKSLQKHLTNFPKSFSELLKKRRSNKKLKTQKMKGGDVRSKKLVEEMLNKLSELESNVFMKR